MMTPAPDKAFKAQLTWATMTLPNNMAHDEAQLLAECMNNVIPARYLLEISGEQSCIHMFTVRPEAQSVELFRRTIRMKTIEAFLELERSVRGRDGGHACREACK